MLIPTLEVPEPRFFLLNPRVPSFPDLFSAHAASALIAFRASVERNTLLPYLDPIVEQLLEMLNPSQGSNRPTKRYVQEQAVTTLAMVANAAKLPLRTHHACTNYEQYLAW